MVWQEGLVLNYEGFGLVNGVTVKTTVAGVEMVDGVECRIVITDRSNDYLQHFWLAQDILGNVWQLRNLDALTNEFHEEDVLYMPSYPQRFEDYDLWDITFSSNYNVDGTNLRVITPAGTFENCVRFSIFEDGVVEEESFAPLVGLVKSEARTTQRSGFTLSSIENFNLPQQPFVSKQPNSQNIIYGTATTLSFHVVSEDAGIYQWYVGNSGDTSVSITGKTSATFQTNILLDNTSYWVRAIVGGQNLDSETAVLTNVPEKIGPQLRGFGSNGWGQFGLGINSEFPSTDLIRSGGVLAASAGTLYSMFITLDGTLWGMGQNSFGQLGEGTFINFLSSPIAIDTNVIKVTAGPDFSLFIKSDNTLWGLGQNDDGQLGTGTTDLAADPVFIDTNVVATSTSKHAEFSHSLYLKADGTLMGMGSNVSGKLGQGNAPGFLSPVVIDTNVIQFSSGIGHSLYIKSDGRLFAMGWNQFGQLGDGTFETRTTPVLIDTDVAKAAGGNNQSFYIKNNGDLYAMGSNILGNGPDTETPVLFDTGVVQLDTGFGQTGWYSKSGDMVYGLGDKALKHTGLTNYSIGGSHTLYLTDNTFELSPVPASIQREGLDSYLIIFNGLEENSQDGFLLQSNRDLGNWIPHPVQQKSTSGSKLTFHVPQSSAPAPHFFQILSTRQ
jgi:alpha-tubulin suppressor-like RCC1 family protein